MEVRPADAADDTAGEFERFAGSTGGRLRVALVARYGLDVGTDACADALAYAWEHWARVRTMRNPAGYLYRVGQSSARRQHRWRRRPDLPVERADGLPEGTDPVLHVALARLSEPQRVAVVLAHVYGWTYAEIGELLGVPLSTVRNHVHRGTTKLRRMLER